MEKALSRKEVLYIEFTLSEEDEKSRSVSDLLREEFLSDIEKGYVYFWVDMSKVHSIRSSLVGTLVYMHENPFCNVLVISGINKKIKDVFTIVGLNKFPKIKIVDK